MKVSFPVVVLCLGALTAISCASIPVDRMVIGTSTTEETTLMAVEASLLAYWLDGTDIPGSAQSDLYALLERDFANPRMNARVLAIKSFERILYRDAIGSERYFQKAFETAKTEAGVLALIALKEPENREKIARLEPFFASEPPDIFVSCIAAKIAMTAGNWKKALIIFDETREFSPPALKTAIDAKRTVLKDLVGSDVATGSGTEAAKAFDFASLKTIEIGAALDWIARETALPRVFGLPLPQKPETFRAIIVQSPEVSISPVAFRDTLSRGQAARLFWYFYSKAKNDPSLLGKYTAKYSGKASNGTFVSPIPDVEFGSQWFDAAFGVTEKGFMKLPDGKSFLPDQGMTGQAFLETVRTLTQAFGY